MFWWTLRSINISAAAQGITVRGSADLTSMTGSRYDDQLFADEASRTVTIKGGNGNDAIVGAGVSSKLYGGNGDDKILGRAGTSYLYGEAGNDIMYGGAGKNYLYGGAGHDALQGGGGVNNLYGGAGNDQLLGGSGQNIFYFASLGEMSGDTITNLKGSDKLYFNVKQAALDLDAIYQNYDLGKTSGKNTISLTGETLTLTDKGNRKYTMTLAGGYTGSINLENSSGQRKSFKL